MKQFWAPNNPGDNITGVNNYQEGLHREVQLLQFLGSRRLQHQRQVEGLRARRPLQHGRSRRKPHAAVQHPLVRADRISARRVADRRRRHLDRQPAHRRRVPWRLAQRDRRLRFDPAGRRRMVDHLAQQRLVQALHHGQHRRAAILPPHEHRRRGIRRRRFLLGPAAQRRSLQRQDLAAARLPLSEGWSGIPQTTAFPTSPAPRTSISTPGSPPRPSTIPIPCTTANSGRPSCWARSTARRR